MSSKNVSISFSAQIGELLDGVKGAKSALESLGTSVNAISSGFEKLAAFAGISFSIDGIKDFAETMAQLGARIDTAHQILGLSTTDVQKYGFVAKATGTDSDTLVQTIGRLQQNLERAQSGIGPTALALQALGLSAKALAALPIDQQMLKLSDAFAKYADGGKKAALANELVRNGAQTLLPAFDKGSEGIKALTDAAVNAGTVMTSQTVTALAAVELKGITLKASLEALGGTLIADSTGLSTFSDWLTNAASDMTALASTGQLGTLVAKVMSEAWERLGRDVALAATLVGDFFTKAHFSDIASDYKAGLASIEDADSNYVAQLDAMVAHAKVAYKDLLLAQSGTGDNRPPPPSSAQPNTAAINAAMSAAAEQIKLADEVYAQQAERLSAEVKLHQITYTQENQALLAALDVRQAAELAAVAREASTGGLSVAQAQKIANEKLEIDQKYVQARQKVIDQGVQEEAQKWQGVLQPIESAWNSQLRGMLAGTETFGQAMKKIAGDMVITWIEGAEKMVVNWTAGELAKTTATTAGVAARTGAEQAGASVSLATQIAANLKAIGSDAAKVFADVFAYLSPVMGPFAAAPAAAASALVLGAETLMPSAAIGGYVVSDGLAMIHGGETILPARINQPYSGGAGGGSQNINLNLSAFNPSGLQQVIRQMMPQMARELGSYQQLNPSTA